MTNDDLTDWVQGAERRLSFAEAETAAQGLAIGNLMAALRDRGVISQALVTGIFAAAATALDHPPNPELRSRCALARLILAQMAAGLGSSLPAEAGGTGTA